MKGETMTQDEYRAKWEKVADRLDEAADALKEAQKQLIQSDGTAIWERW